MVSDARQRAATIVKVFVSTENTKDPRVARIIDGLGKFPAIEVEHAPCDPRYSTQNSTQAPGPTSLTTSVVPSGPMEQGAWNQPVELQTLDGSPPCG